MHRDMLNKATKFEFSSFNMFKCVIGSPVCDFVPRECSAANGPLTVKNGQDLCIKEERSGKFSFKAA